MAANNAEQKLSRESAEQRGYGVTQGWPVDAFGSPMVQISCAQSELIPTRQYANVTLGPVQVTRFVLDGDMDSIYNEIRQTQALCDKALAEDRETLHEQLRNAGGA
jgi:hypothetical protein